MTDIELLSYGLRLLILLEVMRVRVRLRRIRPRHPFRRMIVCGSMAFSTIVIASVTAYTQTLWSSLPVVNAESLRPEESIRILDREGNELYRTYAREDRTSVEQDQIPEVMRQAIIAIEDERFYARPCIDPRAVVRAIKANAEDFKSQGASTITQQLVRLAFLSPEKSFERKLREVMLACDLEGKVSKDDILTLYLNRVSFGQNLSGVASAARAYFGVPPSQLTLAQAAVLASIPQRPSYYTPYGTHLRTSADRAVLRDLRTGKKTAEQLASSHMQMGLVGRVVKTKNGLVTLEGRAEQVLRSMQRLGFISEGQRQEAAIQAENLTFRPRTVGTIQAPHFALLVRDKVRAMMEQNGSQDDWSRAGLQIKTTLDPRLQRLAEETVAELFPDVSSKNGARNMALVAMDRRTREVLAYVGSPDYFDDDHSGKIDMAQVPRQPGSSFKPLVYAAAFEKGFSPSTLIDDTPLQLGSSQPKNYDGTFLGRIPIRQALAWSRNVPAIRAFLFAGGAEPVLQLAAAAGADAPLRFKQALNEDGKAFDFGWPLAIGAAEVPLTEMVEAYATLGDNGTWLPPRTINAIVDAQGKSLYAPPKVDPRQAVPSAVARDIVSILSDPANRPAGWWREQLTIPGLTTTAKTGTSNLCYARDHGGNCTQYGVNNTWTIGMAGDIVVGVWVGNADNATMTPKADGLTAAAPLWKRFLEKANTKI